MNKKNLFAALTVGLGWLALSVQPTVAETISPLHVGPNCTSQIQLPQNKEELELGDVTRAIQNHLLRIGAKEHEVWVDWYADDVVEAEITLHGKLLRHIKVDVVNAEIIERMDYRKRVGFEKLNVAMAPAPESKFSQQMKYSRQLRRHMLGDGQTWAEWLGKNGRAPCLNDYRFGGPEMREPGM